MDRVHPRLVRSRRRRAPRANAVFLFVAAWIVLAAAVSPCGATGNENPERITLDEWGVVIEFRAADRKVASEVASICRKSLPALSAELGLAAIEPFHVFLLSDVRAYEERMGFSLPSWGVAFAFPGNNIVLVDVGRATRAWDTLDKVIPHELSHLLLGQRAAGVRFPLWFMEGLAQWQAGEWSVMESWRLMEAVWGNRAPALGRVVSYMPADENLARDAYRVSYEAFQYRFDEHTERLGDFLEEVLERGDFSEAFAGFWNETEGQFYARFDEHLARKYSSPLMLFQTGPLFTLASVLFVIVVIRIWIRNRRKLRRMEAAERGGPPGPE
jgi:hypothetical protein